MQEALLTVREVAERIKVSTATVYKLCEMGRLRQVRVADYSIRVAEADLADFVSRRTTTSRRRKP
jgi:excisionase family DNA binding protein